MEGNKGEKKKREVIETIETIPSHQENENQNKKKKKKNKYKYFTKCEPKDDEWERRLLHARKKRFAYQNLGMMLLFSSRVKTMNSLRPKYLRILKQLSKGIHKLKLDLRPMGRNLQKEFVKFREVMKRYHSLRTLHLWLRTGVYEENLEDLSESLKGLSTIRDIEVDFGSKPRNQDSHLKILGQLVKRGANLKSFKFHCDAEEMTAGGLAQFCNELKNLGSLEEISLSFSRFESKIFEGLRAGLNEIDSRTNINLQFSCLCFVYNHEIETLQEALQECDFIENLGLEFNGMGDMIDEGVEGLLQNFEALQLLKHFGFFFNQRVSEEIQETLIENLPVLSFLESLSLQFPVNKPVGEKLVLVSQTFKKLEYLRNFHLMCYDPSDEGVSSLGQIFEGLLKVDLFLLHLR